MGKNRGEVDNKFLTQFEEFCRFRERSSGAEEQAHFQKRISAASQVDRRQQTSAAKRKTPAVAMLAEPPMTQLIALNVSDSPESVG